MSKKLLLTSFFILLTACGVDDSVDPNTTPPETDGGAVPEPEFDLVAMITQMTDAIIIPNYDELAISTSDFAAESASLALYCDAIGTADEESSLDNAQDAWRQVMADIQTTEMHAIGPAQENGGTLRNRILSYASGNLSTCGVDQSAILAANADFSISTRALNQRGFGAVEYLLFNDNLGHTCAPQVPETQTWDDLTETERKSMRCSLAKLISTDVASAAGDLADQWTGYRAAFVDEAGAGDTLQLLTDGLFALDKLVKDQKLGIPTGINDACSSLACPNTVESSYSENSLTNIRNNLLAFSTLFTGGEGLGFDDHISAEGFEEVSARFVENVDEAVAIIDASTTSLNAQVLSIENEDDATECSNAFANPDQAADLSACRLLGSIKKITDDLKIDFVTIVGVMIPDSAQSDND